ncbi:sperm-associated antigen related protein [Cyclospora cayetanensis]|uniref:Sperm-associated antigen related protein n=1 Tax=Cyclospora cayetanensis TaxID=88456 RepID=A0A1D3CWH4_9EIME|nr:sperm-associated antigen related protein [Cyclospora cayetanensis]
MGSAEESSSGFPSPDLVGPPGGALGEEGSPMEASGPPGGPHEEDTCSEVSSMSGDEPLSAEEKLAMAISLKDAGNALFKEGQYEQALQKYKEGGKRVKGSSSSEAIAVSVQLSSNSCMCCLKLEKWQEAVEAANGVLQKEPKNLKVRVVLEGQARDWVRGDASVAAGTTVASAAGPLPPCPCKEQPGQLEQCQRRPDGQSGTPLGGLKRRGSKDGGGSGSNNSSSVMEVDEEDAAIINETKKMGYCYFRRNMTEEEKRLNAQNRPTKIQTEASSPQTAVAAADQEKLPEGKSISQWNSKGTTYEEKDVSPWARTRFAERLQEAAANCGSAGMPSPEALLEVCRKATEALGSGGVKDEQAVQDVLKGCYSTKIETLNVQDVSGDAHLAVVRGSRRVFFDMKCSIKLKVSCSSAGPLALPGDDNSVLKEGIGGYESKGTLTLPDVSSADGSGMSWLQGCSVSLSSAPSPLLKPLVDEALAMYKESVAEKIQAFLDDCKALP